VLKGDRLPRLLKLIHTIQAQPGLTAEELARECGVVSRQIYRDLRELDYAGVPLYNDNGYRLAENSWLQEVSFSLDEALSLLYGLKLVERQKELFPVGRVKEHLLKVLPLGLRAMIENLDPSVLVAEGPAVDYAGKAELFRILNRAIRDSRRVELDYYCFGRDERNQRRVDPWHLIFKDGFWYLVGFCHWRRDRRLFRVDRIRHIRLLQDKFLPPEIGVADAAIGVAWGMELGAEVAFQVRFWGDSARFVRETQFHPEQQLVEEPDGAVRLTAKANGLRPVARWILSFGGEAEVVAPQELRAMVTEALRAGVTRYDRDESGLREGPDGADGV
jgi:predicted DNA-binding transcriptional regulator YafY